jgi:hypothetical protein
MRAPHAQRRDLDREAFSPARVLGGKEKKLRPQIAVEAPWSEIGTVARRLIDREFTGKAVLHVL